MDTTRAASMTRSLMNQHGLGHWIFQWNQRKRSNGTCWHHTSTIELSKPSTAARSEDGVLNTIMHEIAHALVGPGHGHDAVWQRKAIELGCDGRTCSIVPDNERALGAYFCTCPDCGKQFQFYRRTPYLDRIHTTCTQKPNRGKMQIQKRY
jgi:predicted SprT family Zn-dependent metalloprotease